MLLKSFFAIFIIFFIITSCSEVKKNTEETSRPTFNNSSSGPIVNTNYGQLEGIQQSGIKTYKGIPYAKPPVGELRWQAPQKPEKWEGVRAAKQFGPRAMQRRLFDDMNFRSDGMSEDCLYLNIWTPAQSPSDTLPVLVYFYGGGLFTGDGSEYRYDGENMARNGIISITVNYRLNIFGFFAHPALTEESPNQASGNYGFLDQAAALQWINENIGAFGGDPNRITIAGESAGSFSVSALMASPLSRDLIKGAIGSSGAIFGDREPIALDEAEDRGSSFAKLIGASSLDDLRAIPAEELLKATAKVGSTHFSQILDGYFFTETPTAVFEAGNQSNVPLLAGWNSLESGYQGILGNKTVNGENYKAALKGLYGDEAEAILKVYPGNTPEQIKQSATDLAGDRFIGFGTWKWLELHRQSTNQPVYRYYFTRPRPRPVGNSDPNWQPAAGAYHSADIEYAMGNLPTNRVYDWTPEDYRTSEAFQAFYLNFVKTGNPNGLGVPKWSIYNEETAFQIMFINNESQQQPDQTRERYLVLDEL